MNVWNPVSYSPAAGPVFENVGGVADSLAKQAAAQPNKAALVYGDQTYTYGRLHARAQTISAALLRVGVDQGDRVALMFPNHPDYVAAFFAVCGIGATLVPVNPLLKHEEIEHILIDSDTHTVIAHESLTAELAKAADKVNSLQHIFICSYQANSVPELQLSQRCLERVQVTRLNCAYIDALEGGNPNSNWGRVLRRQDDLALLVYTSGTTGKPKGAMLSHQNMLAAVQSAHAAIEISVDDTTLAVLPLCHIYGLTVVMLGSISKGGTIIVLDKFEPSRVLDVIAANKISILPIVPAMYQFLLMELEKRSQENRRTDLSSLRICISGAAAMPPDLIAKVEKAFGAPLLEGYGLTEVSCVVSINPPGGPQKAGSVGKAMPGIQARIVSRQTRQEVPPGEIGEVAVLGANVMRGYFRQPEATKECIRNGWFLTGDLGSMDEDGYIYLVGRSKELIIRGGQNIYPREIEDVIARMPAVQEVAVLGVPDSFMGERVKAVVVAKKGETLTQDEVKHFCQEHLAEYKVPRIVEFIEQLPRNSTGKILKRELA